jgi:CBS domain-containing protein
MTVLEAGSSPPIVAYSDELAFDALFCLLQNNIGRLPVVSRENPQVMIGFVNHPSILNAWTRHLEEEGVREHGRLARFNQRYRNSAAEK